MPSFLRLWGEIKDTSFQPSLLFKAVKISPILRTLGELGRNLWIWCSSTYSNFGSNFFYYDYFSLWIMLLVMGVAKLMCGSELLVSFQQFIIRPLAVVLGLMTCIKTVLVQVLLFNLNPSCQREKTSRCHRGHIAGLLAMQLHASPCYTVKHLDYQTGLVHSHFLSTEIFWDTFHPFRSPKKIKGILYSS